MSGHGWVTPNANGMKARCGGPGMCSVCMAEQAEVDAGKPRFKFDDETIDGVPKWLYFRCRSHNHYCKVALRPHRQQNGASWQWNGDREKPTLEPSVNCVGCWHGWIRNGEFVVA